MGGIGSGGYRENAGRKTIDGTPRTQISVTLPAWMVDKLRTDSRKNKKSLSQYMSDCIEKGLEL